jgi:cell division protein FtsB
MAREPVTRVSSWMPPQARRGRLSRLDAWLASPTRPTWAVVVALAFGILFGALAFNSSSLRPELEGVRKDLAGWQGFAAAVQDQMREVAADNAELEDQVADLTAQLEARRLLADLEGSTQQEVEALAEEFGWLVTVRQRASARPAGTVVRQDPPAGTLMSLGAQLTIVVAA